MIENICIALIVVCVFFLARNQMVFHIRGRFIDLDDFPDSYDALPTYDQMIYQARNWHRWTFKQWRRYVSERAA